MEAFLKKPLETVAAKAKAIELIDAHDLVKLEFREGGAFENHDHDDHGHDKKAKAGHDDHDHEKKAEAGHEDHAHGKFDGHIWLDPVNTVAVGHLDVGDDEVVLLAAAVGVAQTLARVEAVGACRDLAD